MKKFKTPKSSHSRPSFSGSAPVSKGRGSDKRAKTSEFRKDTPRPLASEGAKNWRNKPNHARSATSTAPSSSERGDKRTKSNGFRKSDTARSPRREESKDWSDKPSRSRFSSPSAAPTATGRGDKRTKSSDFRKSAAPRTSDREATSDWRDKPTRSRPSSFSARPAAGGRDDKRAKFSEFRKPEKTRFSSRKPTSARPEPKREDFRPATDGVLLWGLHAARAAWLNPKRRITRAWLTESGQKLFEDTQSEGRDQLLKRPDAKRLDREELDRIIPPGSVHQGIVIETAALPEASLHDVIGMDPPPDLILMLDQVTDPHNVGAILRSAAAFGAGAVIMTERNAPTTTGVLAKSASGALECTPMIHVVNLARALDDLREAGYWCVGLAEEGARSLGELDLSGRTVLVLGAEGEGLRHLTRQKCDELAHLPTGGPIGSLNVSNAAAVALYEVRRQTKK